MTRVLCNHGALVHVATAMFGGESTTSAPASSPMKGRDVTEGVGSFEAALANMNNILKWG